MARRKQAAALVGVAKAVPQLLRGRANVGRCPLCGHRTVFVEEGTWLRDHYRCAMCRSLPRHRLLVSVLEQVRPDWRRADIYECAPGGAASRMIQRSARSYTFSHYLPDTARGEVGGRGRSEDIEALTFADASFDIVVTQDVLEHVFHPDRAFAEIARVLRPGGAHVFTVPVHPGRAETSRRARLADGGRVEHLAPPEYHGDPVNPDGALFGTDWGADLPAFVEQHSGLPTEIHEVIDRRRGLDGRYLQVFVSRTS